MVHIGLEKKMWSITKRLAKIRDLAAISLSAQILTLPVSIYVFASFPVWFLLANILRISCVGDTGITASAIGQMLTYVSYDTNVVI